MKESFIKCSKNIYNKYGQYNTTDVIKKPQQKHCKYERKTQNGQCFVWNKYSQCNTIDKNKKEPASIWNSYAYGKPKVNNILYETHKINTTFALQFIIYNI